MRAPTKRTTPLAGLRACALALALLALPFCGEDGDPGGARDGGGDYTANPGDDRDRDGYTVADGDCDDRNPNVNPGATEICADGVDNNCNNYTDALEPDADFDGYGPCQGDCNDRDQGVYPGAEEIYDGKDNDCDGIVDADYDGDGYTKKQGDCDDDDARVYPGAVEDCHDGKDNNCDGFKDDQEKDKDKDGYGPCQGDCDDADPKVHPGAKEVGGDGIDNDCDNMIDADLDGDGWTTENGDCDDTDAKRYPGAPISCSGSADFNCNKIADDAETNDADGDGVGACEGDCDDYDPTRRSGYIEFYGDSVDNDCDGKVDNVQPCDCGGVIDEAQAMDLCQPGVTLLRGGPMAGRALRQSAYGNIKPKFGCGFFMLSTGNAWSTSVQPGANLGSTGNPVMDTGCFKCTTPGSNKWVHPGPSGCCEDRVENDAPWLRLRATAPINAKGFRFDFIFLSSEYPEFVKTSFNDTFYAVAQTQTLAKIQNVSFDIKGQPLTVNNGWFELPANPTQSLSGTGYETYGSSSGWLTTTVPVLPLTDMDITFWIHDEGDHIYDSAVIIDNIRWVSTTVSGPSTLK